MARASSEDEATENDDEHIIREKDYPARKKKTVAPKKRKVAQVHVSSPKLVATPAPAQKQRSPLKKKRHSSSALGVKKKGVWFVFQAQAKKWDVVVKRSVIHGKLFDEEKYTVLLCHS